MFSTGIVLTIFGAMLLSSFGSRRRSLRQYQRAIDKGHDPKAILQQRVERMAARQRTWRRVGLLGIALFATGAIFLLIAEIQGTSRWN